MLKFSKPIRIRDRKHLEFIRTLPCVRDVIKIDFQEPLISFNYYDIQAAHIRKNTNGGIGIKPSDSYVVSLCADCHRDQHQKGEVAFWGSKLDSAIELAKKLYSVSGDREGAIKAINEAGL